MLEDRERKVEMRVGTRPARQIAVQNRRTKEERHAIDAALPTDVILCPTGSDGHGMPCRYLGGL